MLSAEETVEHLLHYNRVEFDEFGESLDDFVLDEEKKQQNVKLLKWYNYDYQVLKRSQEACYLF